MAKTVRRSDAYRRAELNALIDQAMKSDKFQAMLNQMMEEASIKAMCRLTFLGCEWGELEYDYKREDIERFVKWMLVRFNGVYEDDAYVKDASKYYKEKHGVDVLNLLGLGFTKK